MEEPKVIYEDDDVLALDKPAGIVVHHDATHTSGTVVDWLLENRPEVKGVGESPDRPGIVHRLDKDTSGVLLVAKNQDAFLYIKKLFQSGGIEKKYQTLVIGEMKDESGIVNEPIARSTKNFQKRVVGGGQGRSREAITHYHVLERLPDYTLVEASPKTGRTHQIRSHLAHIGYPVACDKLYGGKRYICPTGLGRQFLHAYSLIFDAPSGKKLELVSPLPKDLADALRVLRAIK
ncbi:MAG: RluA family pseudouridine synthase [Patescibacteria group bacterium]